MSHYAPSRDKLFLTECADKRVLHIGACDWPFTKERWSNGDLLYKKIDSIAKEQLGIDLNEKMVDYLNKQNTNNSSMVHTDMNMMKDLDFKPDVIIFGETLEHLMNLESALTSLKSVMQPHTKLLISVPNANHLMGFVYALLGYESQHEDHKVAFTYKTLKQLLEYNNFSVDHIKFTWLTGSISSLNWKGKVGFYILRPFSRLFPMFSGTLFVSASLNK